MKSKEELEALAYEIAGLEMKIKNAKEDKLLQSYMSRIENIMESLSVTEGLSLNDTILNILNND